jgi:uncharacterized membrane protein
MHCAAQKTRLRVVVVVLLLLVVTVVGLLPAVRSTARRRGSSVACKVAISSLPSLWLLVVVGRQEARHV